MVHTISFVLPEAELSMHLIPSLSERIRKFSLPSRVFSSKLS